MAVSQTITSLPTPPKRGVDAREEFVSKGEQFFDALHDVTVTELNTAFTQLNALETNVNNKETIATTKASEAAASATLATTNGQAQVTLATAQVTIATTKASEASTSATNASQALTDALAAKTAAEAAANLAASALDYFDDRYLGSKATPPTLDNDGNALIVGALYWDTSVPDHNLRVWNGTLWQDYGVGVIAGVSSVNARAGDVTLNKADVGLANVENTSDLAKPISTATTNALTFKVDTADVLTKTNTTPYSPSSQYEPATKAYVDAMASSGGGNVEITQIYRYVATEAQTTFNADYILGSLNVTLNGIELDSADYTAADTTTVVLATGVNVGDIVRITSYGGADVYNKSQTDALLGAKQNTITTAKALNILECSSVYTDQATDMQIQDITTWTDGYIYYITNKRIRRTKNGQHMQDVYVLSTAFPDCLRGICAHTNGSLYVISDVGSYSKLIKSTDGTTWTVVYTFTTENAWGSRSVFSFGGNLYVCSQSGGQNKVYRSTNNGTSWTLVLSGYAIFPNKAKEISGTLVAVDPNFGGTTKTTDGITWTPTLSNYTGVSDIVPVSTYILGVAWNSGNIYKTTDNTTWTIHTSIVGCTGISRLYKHTEYYYLSATISGVSRMLRTKDFITYYDMPFPNTVTLNEFVGSVDGKAYITSYTSLAADPYLMERMYVISDSEVVL